MAIDFFEKEVENLKTRLNSVYGTRTVFNIQSRYNAIMAICRAMMIIGTIKNRTDDKCIEALTREFCRIHEDLNRFFDLMESQKERGINETTDHQQIIAACP